MFHGPVQLWYLTTSMSFGTLLVKFLLSDSTKVPLSIRPAAWSLVFATSALIGVGTPARRSVAEAAIVLRGRTIAVDEFATLLVSLGRKVGPSPIAAPGWCNVAEMDGLGKFQPSKPYRWTRKSSTR